MSNNINTTNTIISILKGAGIIHIAILCNNVKELKNFLENGADIDQKNDCGMTPLLVAASCAHLESGIFLINNGADLHSKYISYGDDCKIDQAIDCISVCNYMLSDYLTGNA
ncbi:MAG: ankyrin repeat domain-containing protein [Rickettsiales bacterium]